MAGNNANRTAKNKAKKTKYKENKIVNLSLNGQNVDKDKPPAAPINPESNYICVARAKEIAPEDSKIAAEKQQKITESVAKSIALAYYAANYSSSGATGEAYIEEMKKDLEFTKKLKNSYYKYTPEAGRLGGYKIAIEIDSRTGAVTPIDRE